MGRLKLRIKRLESNSNRQVTYSKRRNGILKKAKELSVLCDIDLALLMFSPTGRPTMFQGDRSNFDEVITKFSQITPQERTKRKLESLEALKKTFKKVNHEVNVEDFTGSSTQSVEDLTNQVTELQAQLTGLERRLSCWSNPYIINDLEHLIRMEDMLRESINRLRIHKENFRKHNVMPLASTHQFQNEMSLPLIVGGIQEGQPLPWIPSNESHSSISTEPNFLQHGDVQCALNSGCSGYFGDECGKQMEAVGQGNLRNVEEECELSELSRSDGLNVDFRDQYVYSSFTTDGLSEDKFKPDARVNFQQSSVDYKANSNSEIPSSSYDNAQHAWSSAFGPDGLTLYDQNVRQQQFY